MFAGVLAKPNRLRPYPRVRGNRTAQTNTNVATGHNFATFTPPRDREHGAEAVGELRREDAADERTSKRAPNTEKARDLAESAPAHVRGHVHQAEPTTTLPQRARE